jgi:glutamate 5-kinase
MNKNTGHGRLAIKVGSNVVTARDGFLDLSIIEDLVRQISVLKQKGIEVVLISSGAVASGKSLYKPKSKLDDVGQRQLWSALGQVRLIQTYSTIFDRYGLLCSQVLVTRDDFRSRQHYLNIKNCFSVLLSNNIIPIVNENDVVSVTELMFTDNDELAGLVATMLNVEKLIVLTTVDGVLKENGGNDIIEDISPGEKSFEKFIQVQRSSFGRGGMITKAHMAQKVAASGITVHIANGTRRNALLDVIDGKLKHTVFKAADKKSNIKKWLSHAKGFQKGSIRINEGAIQMLRSGKASSILPIGVIEIIGSFEKGDIIEITDSSKNEVGLGMAQYNDKKAKELMGIKNQKPIIHYDYLYLMLDA